MVASTKRISFGFQCEEFDDDIFTKQLADTLERFERDIKRKCNKFSIARGTYNYTKAEIDHTQYMAVDEVYCAVDGEVNDCRKVNEEASNCQKILCSVILNHDNRSSSSQLEYDFFQVAQGYTIYGEHSSAEYLEYLGPFPIKTSSILVQSELSKHRKMDENEVDVYLSKFSDFISTGFEGVKIHSASLTEEVIESSTMRTEITLLSSVKYVMDSFQESLDRYVNTHSNYFAEELRGTNIDYFSSITNITIPNNEAVETTKTSVLKPSLSSNIQIELSGTELITCMFSILFITLLVTFMGIQKKKMRRNIHREKCEKAQENLEELRC